MSQRILILGGTRDAREIASRLVALGHDVTTSLAGVTTKPLLPVGKLRVGGFGGAAGLRENLQENRIEVLIDATHPFAAIISHNAALAAKATRVKLMCLERPAWQPRDGDRWINVANTAEAANALPSNARALVTIGRKELAAFFARSDIQGAVRSIEPPDVPLPPNWTLILERPPFTFETEKQLLAQFTHLVTKNAGGQATVEKLEAARALALPVIMIDRPIKQGGEVYSDVNALVAAIKA